MLQKKTKKCFVGCIERQNAEEETVDVKFLKKIGTGRFTYPEKLDTDTIDLEDIEQILPNPTSVGGTKRASKQFMFGVDINL